MKLPLYGLGFLAIFLAGCARVNTSTTVNADGSYSRKIDLKVSKTTTGMGSAFSAMGDSKDAKPPMDKPEDYFQIPKIPGMKLVRSEDKTDSVVTLTRAAAAGAEPVQDIALWAEKGKVLATSTVVVTKLPDGKIEYIETLHTTKVSKDSKFQFDQLRPRVKKVIPVELQTTENIDRATRAVAASYVHALFGPPEPMVFNMFTSPEVMLRRINSNAFVENSRSFQEIIPSLTEAQADEMARNLAEAMADTIMGETESMSEPKDPKEKSSVENEMTPLTFSVKFPGKVVESNGLLDRMTGEIYWSLLPAGLEMGDVKLRVVIQP